MLVCQKLNNHIFLMCDKMPFCSPLLTVFQGFTYVAPSVLESVKEKFSFEPKIRSPRRFIGSPRTPVSPVKFSPGDFWGRGASASTANPQTPVEFPMETSGIEQMDVTMSGEASAPLPIRQPNSGPYKKQAFPMISKRPEHLRMNLWQSNAFNEFKAKKEGRGCVSILQGETRRLKMTVSKSQCHYIEHFGPRKNKHGFLKINQWCKKKT